MAHEVKIPAAGESINSATVGRWHKADGEAVRKGEVLATIETDKVSTELEAEVSGTLKILVPEGQEVAIGTLIAGIEEGEAAAPEPAAAPERTAARPDSTATPEPATAPGLVAASSAPAPLAAVRPPASPDRGGGEVIEIKVPSAGESITSASIAQWHKRDGETIVEGESLVTLETDKVSAELEADASGVLKILAAEGSEVAIGAVIGTIALGETAGLAERPQSAPVPEAAVSVGAAPPAAARQDRPRPAPVPAAAPARLLPDLTLVPPALQNEASAPRRDGRTTRQRMSPLRRKIARQLVNAQQTAAILTTFNEADMSAVMKLRKTLQEAFVEKYGVKLGFMSFFVKAAVQALREVPAVNGRIDGEEIVRNHFYDIGIAVGTEKGLFVPVVRDADGKSAAQIEMDIIDYANRAREGKIQLEDLQGGSFTITNGGIYGSLLSTPILNPPQSGILGMHTIQQRPVAIDGKVEVRPMMYLALSYDHRLVDGKEAVTFLNKVKECIENPARMMLEL